MLGLKVKKKLKKKIKGLLKYSIKEHLHSASSNLCCLLTFASLLLSSCSQQDAQEFLRFLLDGLHNEVNRVTVRPRGSVEDFDHLP